MDGIGVAWTVGGSNTLAFSNGFLGYLIPFRRLKPELAGLSEAQNLDLVTRTKPSAFENLRASVGEAGFWV